MYLCMCAAAGLQDTRLGDVTVMQSLVMQPTQPVTSNQLPKHIHDHPAIAPKASTGLVGWDHPYSMCGTHSPGPSPHTLHPSPHMLHPTPLGHNPGPASGPGARAHQTAMLWAGPGMALPGQSMLGSGLYATTATATSVPMQYHPAAGQGQYMQPSHTPQRAEAWIMPSPGHGASLAPHAAQTAYASASGSTGYSSGTGPYSTVSPAPSSLSPASGLGLAANLGLGMVTKTTLGVVTADPLNGSDGVNTGTSEALDRALKRVARDARPRETANGKHMADQEESSHYIHHASALPPGQLPPRAEDGLLGPRQPRDSFAEATINTRRGALESEEKAKALADSALDPVCRWALSEACTGWKLRTLHAAISSRYAMSCTPSLPWRCPPYHQWATAYT